MTIAVNAITAGLPDADVSFLLTYAEQLAQQQPQHQFIIICNTPAANKITAPNITCLLIKQQFAAPLSLQYWLRFTLPGILKKHTAAIVLHNNYCLLRSSIPQVLFISDDSFMQHPDFYKKNWLQYYKKNMPGFIKKAAAVITSSAYIKNNIESVNEEAAEKIMVHQVIINAAFAPAVHWQQKETVKEKFTAGKEYFLYSGLITTDKNLITLLKAFTFFKQRQKSNMQLVLLSAKPAQKKFLTALSSYKYKKEVLVADSCSVVDIATITAAAYALVQPVLYDGAGVTVMQAIYCGVPVIAAQVGALPEVCGDAAVYCNPSDFNDIASKMMLLFKNEDERNNLIAKGRQLKEQHQKQTYLHHGLLQKWAGV
jgi:glycosyltransferase involved in cell wall biosynthesis